MLTTDPKKLLDVLTSLCPKGKNLDSFAAHLSASLPKYGINTHKRIAMFLAHAIHETGGFRLFEENFNYTAEGLAKTWPSRYANPDKKPNALALKLAKQPVAIANNCYANRMGNGSEASGEGAKFIGRGIFQLTGKDNYKNFLAAFPDSNAVTEPQNLALPKWAVLSACHYWQSRDLNKDADSADVKSATKKINGGENGLEDRAKYYCKLVAL